VSVLVSSFLSSLRFLSTSSVVHVMCHAAFRAFASFFYQSLEECTASVSLCLSSLYCVICSMSSHWISCPQNSLFFLCLLSCFHHVICISVILFYCPLQTFFVVICHLLSVSLFMSFVFIILCLSLLLFLLLCLFLFFFFCLMSSLI